MPDMVPIKIKLLRKSTDGHIDWPDFNKVSSTSREGMLWSIYIDVKGLKWHYDKVENLGTGALEGAACTCVTKAFADEAVALFPGLVSKLTETEWESFYNDRAHAHEPEIFDDVEALQALKVKLDLGILSKTDKEYTDAINPDLPAAGRKRNPDRSWSQVKSRKGINIVQ